MRWLTGIVVVFFGSNVLGLLEFLLTFGLFIACENYINPFSARLSKMAILGSMASIIGFDFQWRYREKHPPGKWRFFSPFSGGSVLYLPIWLFFPSLIAAGGIAILLKPH